MWDDVSIAGRTRLNVVSFGYRQNIVALSGNGRLADGPATRSFHYDDTAFGAVPAGLLRTLATCAVVSGGTHGRYVQLFVTAVNRLGFDATSSVTGGSTNGGQIEAFTVSMANRGPLTLAEANKSTAANGLVTFGSLLPWAMPPQQAPFLCLMRPSALSWPGQDGNEAAGTLWNWNEVGVCNFDFTVNSQSLDMQLAFFAVGFA